MVNYATPKLLVKVAVSAAIFYLIFSRVNVAAAAQAIAKSHLSYLILAFCLSLVMAITDAALWRSVLGSLGHRISFGPAILYSIVGSFFGSFGPSGTGVDIFRAAQMRRLGIPLETAIRAIISTRLVSFVSLIAIIACGFPILLGCPLDLHDKFLLVFPIAIGIGLLSAVVAFGRLRSRVSSPRRSGVIGQAAEIGRDLARVLTSRSHSPPSLLFSTLTHLLRIATFAAIAASINAGIPLMAMFALIPVSLLVAMIPITLGSWGVREASVIFFLAWAGVPSATALSISVIFGLLRIAVAAIGGIVWVFTRPHHYRLAVAAPSEGRPDV
jgi:uncharacterized membrane protein YbhN (UPF0104 family)